MSDKATLETLLRENISFKVRDRFDGAHEQNGKEVILLFNGHKIASIYFWEGDNAGLIDVEDYFWEDGEDKNDV